MSVTDLTNTTWKLNNTLLSSIATTYYDIQIDEIHYTQNGVDGVINLRYGAFSGGLDTHSSYYILFVNGDGDNMVYYDGGHYYASGVNGYIENITFTILGGYATTNSTLISWLETNATQQSTTKTYKLGWRIKQSSWPGTDLTGTTWLFNSGVYVPSLFNTMYINFNSYHNNYTSMSFNNNMGTIKYNNTMVYDEENIGGWMLEDFQTIIISGGTDSTNSQFISWLQDNATLQSW